MPGQNKLMPGCARVWLRLCIHYITVSAKIILKQDWWIDGYERRALDSPDYVPLQMLGFTNVIVFPIHFHALP